jgi:hypothetical protein
MTQPWGEEGKGEGKEGNRHNFRLQNAKEKRKGVLGTNLYFLNDKLLKNNAD